MILAFSTTWRLVVCLNVLSAVSHALRVHYSTGMQVRRLQEHWIWQLTAELKLASTALLLCCSDEVGRFVLLSRRCGVDGVLELEAPVQKLSGEK